MKFKNLKKKAKKAKSPSNSRTIPALAKASSFAEVATKAESAGKSESFKLSFPKFNSLTLLKIYRGSLKVFIVLIFLCTAVIIGIDLQKNLNTKTNIDIQGANLTKELKFWENFISEHKDYRDAYFQASILEYRLGNTSKAKTYAEKGLGLDPNSEDGRKLEQFLVNK